MKIKFLDANIPILMHTAIFWITFFAWFGTWQAVFARDPESLRWYVVDTSVLTIGGTAAMLVIESLVILAFRL